MIPSYDRGGLCRLVEEVSPDVGLLLSVFPETFSYTLHELQMLGIPPVATRIGSFADWIDHGENGFLADPRPESLVELLRSLWRGQIQAETSSPRPFEFRGSEPGRNDPRLSRAEWNAVLSSEVFQWSGRASSAEASGTPTVLANSGPGLLGATQRRRFSTRFVASDISSRLCDTEQRSGTTAFGSVDAAWIFPFAQSFRYWDAKKRRFGRWGAIPMLCVMRSSCSASLSLNVLAVEALLLCLFGEDPHILLPIPDTALTRSQGAGTIEVEFTPEPEFETSTERGAGKKDSVLLTSEFRIVELAEALQRARHDLASAELRSAQAEQHLQHARAEVAQREQVIAGLQESVSWKITKPLRALAHAGRKDKNDDESAAG